MSTLNVCDGCEKIIKRIDAYAEVEIHTPVIVRGEADYRYMEWEQFTFCSFACLASWSATKSVDEFLQTKYVKREEL